MSQMTSAARVGARALNRPTTGTPRLRVVPGAGAPLRRGDAAFGIFCVLLLATGLIGLLLLNTSLAQGSFVLHDLRATSDELTDAQGALTQSLDASKSPANLATRATALGMVPAQSAAFLRLSDGKVIGVAKPASAGSRFTVVGTTAPPAPAVTDPANPASAPAASQGAAPARSANAASAPSATRPATPAAAGGAVRPAKR
jgi:hypothetical protein